MHALQEGELKALDGAADAITIPKARGLLQIQLEGVMPAIQAPQKQEGACLAKEGIFKEIVLAENAEQEGACRAG